MRITTSFILGMALISGSAFAEQKSANKISLQCPAYLDANMVFSINISEKTATAGTKSNDGKSNSYSVTNVVISDTVFRIRYTTQGNIREQFTIDRVTGSWTQEAFGEYASYESTDYLTAKKSDGSNLCRKANVKQKTKF